MKSQSQIRKGSRSYRNWTPNPWGTTYLAKVFPPKMHANKENWTERMGALQMHHATRMHSSRMRTVHCTGHLRGCLPLRVSAKGGVHPLWNQRQTPPVNRITESCKNITFPQLLLRTVITTYYYSRGCFPCEISCSPPVRLTRYDKD